MGIRENLQTVNENIARAAAAANRRFEDITLVAVTKFVSVERILEAAKAGVRQTGENRAQEFAQKYEILKEENILQNFIGQLQVNKVKLVIGKASLIQSVDRLELAQEIQKRAEALNIVQDVLLQVNIGDEPQKGGSSLSSTEGLLQRLSTLPNIRVKGLMCIPPAVNADEARPYFAKLKALYDRLKSTYPSFEHLSMGMSGDYTAAILEGATMVRVGSALFGGR